MKKNKNQNLRNKADKAKNPVDILKKYHILPSSFKEVLFAIWMGVSAALVMYFWFFQRHFFSKRYIVYSSTVGIVVGIASSWILKTALIAKFKKLDKSRNFFSICVSFLFSVLVLINLSVPPAFNLVPKTNLQVTIPLAENAEPVRLLWIKNGQGFVHFSNLQINGSWERKGKHIVFPPGQDVQLKWQGAIGPYTEFVFRQPATDQVVWVSGENNVQVEVNLQSESKNLIIDKQSDGTANVIIPVESKINLLCYLPPILSFISIAGFCVFFIVICMSDFPKKRTNKRKNRRFWLLYALPMIVVWSIVLAIFWPGIMTNDGFGQWAQMETGVYNKWQSVIYSLLIFILTRFWSSPAVIALAQIIILAVVVADGLKTFEKQGVNRIVLWCLSILFAAAPMNSFFQSILWKDIPYAIIFLWLTICLLKIHFSEGSWIRDWRHAAALIICFTLLPLFRKNGLAVSVAVAIALIIFYTNNWKTYLLSALVSSIIYFSITGPLYSMLDISDESGGQSNLIYLHHFAAHIDAGTHLAPEETAYLESFLPLEGWNYWCYYVGPISYYQDFARNEFLSSGSANRELARKLIKRNPKVDIEHTLCASQLVWRVKNTHAYIKSTHGFHSWIPGREGWVVENRFGIQQSSLIPSLVQPYMQWLKQFGFADDFLVWYLRPALYLYLTVFIFSVAYLRKGKIKIWLTALPVFAQSAVLFLISFAPAYRYQYGTFLAGLYLVGLLFLPKKEMLADET